MKAVHVGFPKTAATFLQTRVFARLPSSFAYVGKEGAPLFAPIAEHDDTIFDLEGVRRAFAAAWRGRAHCLFSYEALTGSHYRSGFVNRTLIARRLRDVGFDRVIVTIRNQPDALESAYKQYVKSGGTLRFDDYVALDPTKPRYLYPEYFDYLPFYRLYAGLFGAENVLVLQYEHLRTPGFLAALCRFLEIEPIATSFDRAVNRSLSRDKTAVLRVLNHVAYSSYQPSHLVSRKISTAFLYRRLAALPCLNGRKSFWDEQRRQAVADLFAWSNDELQRAAGIELAPQYPRLSARTPRTPAPS
jgi:hypothetical protein